MSMVVQVPEKSNRYKFALGKLAFSGLPLSPESVDRRKTLLTEVVKDTIWTLDQVQGIINVNVPVRCTVVKLSGGGLFVNNPVAELEAVHGPVKITCPLLPSNTRARWAPSSRPFHSNLIPFQYFHASVYRRSYSRANAASARLSRPVLTVFC